MAHGSVGSTPAPLLLAFYAFPPAHWSKLRSTDPLERVNREIGRRTDVVGIFPTSDDLTWREIEVFVPD